MAVQVQLRGGTSKEHSDFIGADREITVDTTLHSLRVHDGKTYGGHLLALSSDLVDFSNNITSQLEEFQDNISSTHNHNTLYSSLNHNHNSTYAVKPTSSSGIFIKALNGYNGLVTEGNNDTDYIRCTKSGILPYQSGGYSALGSTSWRFANGYFVNLDATKLTTSTLKVTGSIVFANDNDTIKYDDTTNEFTFSADDSSSKSIVSCGVAKINTHKIYVDSAFPSDAIVGDILIQI